MLTSNQNVKRIDSKIYQINQLIDSLIYCEYNNLFDNLVSTKKIHYSFPGGGTKSNQGGSLFSLIIFDRV